MPPPRLPFLPLPANSSCKVTYSKKNATGIFCSFLSNCPANRVKNFDQTRTFEILTVSLTPAQTLPPKHQHPGPRSRISGRRLPGPTRPKGSLPFWRRLRKYCPAFRASPRLSSRERRVLPGNAACTDGWNRPSSTFCPCTGSGSSGLKRSAQRVRV